MPVKHQPDRVYIRKVRIRRIHLFTAIQVICLVILWVIKTTAAAITFPLMVSLSVSSNVDVLRYKNNITQKIVCLVDSFRDVVNSGYSARQTRGKILTTKIINTVYQ